MAQMLKYRLAGDVLAAEATDKTLDDLAELAGAQTFTAPNGDRYALVETADGTTRLDVGGYLVQHGDGKRATYAAVAADEFAASYTR